MTTKTAGGTGRSAAARKAAEAVARRAAEFQKREKELLALATEFHVAVDKAEKVRADSEAKAARLVQDADAKAAVLREKAGADAAGFDEQALAAVRRMIEFGESRDAIMQITGWPAARIREAQRADGGRRAS